MMWVSSSCVPLSAFQTHIKNSFHKELSLLLMHKCSVILIFLTSDEDMGAVFVVPLGAAMNGDKQLASACASGRREGLLKWPAQTPLWEQGLECGGAARNLGFYVKSNCSVPTPDLKSHTTFAEQNTFVGKQFASSVVD